MQRLSVGPDLTSPYCKSLDRINRVVRGVSAVRRSRFATVAAALGCKVGTIARRYAVTSRRAGPHLFVLQISLNRFDRGGNSLGILFCGVS